MMEYDVLLSMLEKREFKELKDELESMHPVCWKSGNLKN